jgi:hypothetical protein
VRERVWKPENRDRATPEHALRAGLQASWRCGEVEEVVVDALAGHETGTTLDRHYSGNDLIEKMRRAE